LETPDLNHYLTDFQGHLPPPYSIITRDRTTAADTTSVARVKAHRARHIENQNLYTHGLAWLLIQTINIQFIVFKLKMHIWVDYNI